MVDTRRARSTSQNVDGNETASVQQLAASNQRMNADAQPGAALNQAEAITRTEFNELMRELLDSRRQLNEQIQANATLMNQIVQQPRQNVEESPAPDSLSKGSDSSDEHPRRRRRHGRNGTGRDGETWDTIS